MGDINRTLRAIALSTTFVVIIGGCGSTASQTEQQVAQTTDDGLGDLAGSGTLPEGAHINDKGQVVSSSGEVLGSAEDFGISTDGSGNTASGDTTGGPGSIPVGGSGGGSAEIALPGVTSTKIYVAAAYNDSGAANSSAFGTPLDADFRKSYNAMIEEVNKAGGILGRKVVPLYRRFDAASSQTIDQQTQAACSYWTEDNKVAFMLADDPNGVLKECAKKAGAIHPTPGGGSLPEIFNEYPHYFEMSDMTVIRAGDVTVTGLNRLGYFKGDPKLGIMLWDTPDYRATLDRGFLPELKKIGIQLATEPAYITPPQTFNDLAATSADVNNAVLRFQSQGITHVMILDGPAGLCAGACLGTLFLRRAEQQNYRPRYGFNANNQAKGAQDAGLYPPEQLRNSVAVEWADHDKSYDEGWHLNQARESCYKLMRKHNVPLENANQQYGARTACDQFRFIQAAIAKMGNAPLTADNFILGVNALGWNWNSASAFSVHFSATQHDGLAAARNMVFVNSCECYKWKGDPYRV